MIGINYLVFSVIIIYSLHALVLNFPFLARNRILKPGIVATMDHLLADFTKATLTGNNKERCVEERMVFTEIFFSLGSSPVNRDEIIMMELIE